MIYPDAPVFPQQSNYSRNDKYLISHVLWRGCKLVYQALSPVVGMQADIMYRGLRIEFTDVITKELEDYGAIGLSWRDRNVNYMPARMGQLDFQGYSGVFMMELTHSLIARLVNDHRMSNDLIHYLYNEGFLSVYEYWNALGVLKWRGSIKMILPDMRYAWENKEEIMAGIRSGKYAEGNHEYWSDPAYKGVPVEAIAATQHELDQIKWFIEHGHQHR